MSEWGTWGDYTPPASVSGQVEREYREVPAGTYTVFVNDLKLKQSKSGFPMLTARFRVADGEYKGESIFMNQILIRNQKADAFTINICNDFLKALKIIDDRDIVFNSVPDYASLVSEIADHIGSKKYSLTMGTNKKGYKTFKVQTI